MIDIFYKTIPCLFSLAGLIAGMSILAVPSTEVSAGTVISRTTYDWTYNQFIDNCRTRRADVVCDHRVGQCVCDDNEHIWVWVDPQNHPPPHHVIRMPSPGSIGAGGDGGVGGGRGKK